jgi:hypothetical protein
MATLLDYVQRGRANSIEAWPRLKKAHRALSVKGKIKVSPSMYKLYEDRESESWERDMAGIDVVEVIGFEVGFNEAFKRS